MEGGSRRVLSKRAKILVSAARGAAASPATARSRSWPVPRPQRACGTEHYAFTEVGGRRMLGLRFRFDRTGGAHVRPGTLRCRLPRGLRRRPRPQGRAREVLARAVSDPSAVLAALGEPERAGIGELFHSDRLTILNVVWAPGMAVMPHNHRMWAVIGIY